MVAVAVGRGVCVGRAVQMAALAAEVAVAVGAAARFAVGAAAAGSCVARGAVTVGRTGSEPRLHDHTTTTTATATATAATSRLRENIHHPS